jgi:hypothetical protein
VGEGVERPFLTGLGEESLRAGNGNYRGEKGFDKKSGLSALDLAFSNSTVALLPLFWGGSSVG